jgi:hypothetical protein
MGQHIDESGGDYLAGRIDFGARAQGSASSDVRDAVTVDRDVALKRALAGAIDYLPVADDEVVQVGCRSTDAQGRRDQDTQQNRGKPECADVNARTSDSR